MPVFDGDDFESFSEQLDCYFHANDVVDEGKQKSILLASLSPEHYRLLGDLVAPNRPRDDGLAFRDIVEKMKAHMAPEKSLQLARFQFDRLSKGAEERVAEFVARIKHSSVACKFTAGERPARLRDRFIAGLQDAKMVSAVLRLKGEAITFDSAVSTATAVEQTHEDVRAITGHAGSRAPRDARTTFDAGRTSPRVRRGDPADMLGMWRSTPAPCMPV